VSEIAARIRPSALHRIVGCTGYLKATDGRRGGTNVWAEEGTAAHWVVSERLFHGVYPEVGVLAENGVAITQDMIDHGELYVNHVEAISKSTAEMVTTYVEQRIKIPLIHPTECFGTVDCYALLGRRVLHVRDYKYGKVEVDPYENLQLIAYALGLVSEYDLPGECEVHMTIVQPRVDDPIKTWTTTVSDLRMNYLPDIAYYVAEALGDNPKLTTGDHCRYCEHLYDCDAVTKSTHQFVETSVTVRDMNLSDDQIIGDYEYLERGIELAKLRMASLGAQMTHKINAGQKMGDYELDPSWSKSYWTCGNDKLESLSAVTGIELMDKKPVSPAQAKKRGLSEELVKTISKRSPTGNYKLQKINFKQAARKFKK